MYLTYTEYMDHGGSMERIRFERLEYKAERKLRNLTFARIDRMEQIPEAVKKLVFELVEITANADAVQTGADGAVTSFSNDGYSESYGRAKDGAYYDALFEDACRDFLLEETDDLGIPLMFCGVNANEYVQ